MKAKPILFNTETVQAILAGRKTVTRQPVRVDTPDEFEAHNNCRELSEFGADVPCFISRKYDVGDILYVREKWQNICVVPSQYAYKADGEFEPYSPWKSAIYMPREAARIFLRVTNVKVERLQDITEKEAEAEGENALLWGLIPVLSAKGQFQDLWNSLYAKKGYRWEQNPWVWVISFEIYGRS